MQLAFLDLETTGIAPAIHWIVEVAIVRTDGLVELGRWSSLVATEAPVGASERVHGIGDAMLVGAPSLASLRDTIASKLEGATLVAHRADFDRAFLEAAAERGELRRPSALWIDTARVADRVLGESGLRAIARRIGGRAPAHRALPDALAALDALAACIETMGAPSADELAALCRTAPSLREEHAHLFRAALGSGEPVSVVYRPASGRLLEDRLQVESLDSPYVTGTLEHKRVRRVLRGDRIVRAWTGPRPALRFL